MLAFWYHDIGRACRKALPPIQVAKTNRVIQAAPGGVYPARAESACQDAAGRESNQKAGRRKGKCGIKREYCERLSERSKLTCCWCVLRGRSRIGDDLGCCESWSDLTDADLCVLTYLAVFYKDNKSLYPCNAVAFAADFCDLNVVFLTSFYWFWTEVVVSSSVTHT